MLVNRVPEDGEPLTAISHAMLALINNPEQLAYLRDKPAAMQTGLEELLRWRRRCEPLHVKRLK